MCVVGLMSGTSMDGVDAALVTIHERPRSRRIRLLQFATWPYPEALRRRLLRVATGDPVGVEEFCRLNVDVGECFAEAARRIIKRAGLSPSRVALIGSHGQTVCHLPPRRSRGRRYFGATLQIAEPSVIAERTGITTIADFRPRDLAAGGHGAPLTPALHCFLFHHPAHHRVVVNIGGISNVTDLPPGGRAASLLAFDTGPGNMLIDGLIALRTRGRLMMDRNGRLAQQGRICQPLLERLLRHPYLSRRPPKTTGREGFGPMALRPRFGRYWSMLTTPDLIATVSAFTADAIAFNCRRFLPGGSSIHEVIVSGGGSRNRFLMERLQLKMPDSRICRAEAYGYDSRAIEAIAFALLAYETAHGRTANIPSATGASREVILGNITPGRWAVRVPLLPSSR